MNWFVSIGDTVLTHGGLVCMTYDYVDLLIHVKVDLFNKNDETETYVATDNRFMSFNYEYIAIEEMFFFRLCLIINSL